jgi:hypothetical protein
MSPVQNFEQHSRHLVEPDLSKSIPLHPPYCFITKFLHDSLNFGFHSVFTLFCSNFGRTQFDYRNVELILICVVVLEYN